MVKGRRCGWAAVAQVFETGHLEWGVVLKAFFS